MIHVYVLCTYHCVSVIDATVKCHCSHVSVIPYLCLCVVVACVVVACVVVACVVVACVVVACVVWPQVRTTDIGGTASTSDFINKVIDNLASMEQAALQD